MKIKVSTLKPGDILVFDRNQHGEKVAASKCIVCAVTPSPTPGAYTVMQFGMNSRMLSEFTRDCDVEFEVERTGLTPAQQHADELLDMVRRARADGGQLFRGDIDELLAKIDPPKPPTAQELAASLAKLATDGILPLPDHAMTLLARARQAGML